MNNENLSEKKTPKITLNSKWLWLDKLAPAIFAIFILFAIRYQIKLLSYTEWGDESETIVAAKMIAAGERLYSVIFNHHGPLVFLPGIVLEKMGSFGVTGHRVYIMFLQLGAMLALYFSPIIQGRFTKFLYVMAAMTAMLLYFPDIFGNMYTYQVLTGLALVVILAQYTLPSMLCQERLSSANIIFGNLLIASIPFLGIPFVPVSVMLFTISLRKRFLTKAISAFVGGGLINVAFLALIGSIPGYLIYHIYLNLSILSQYNSGINLAGLIKVFSESTSGNLQQFTISSVLIAAICRLANTENEVPWRSALLALGVGSLLIRGAGFHAVPYFYTLLAIPLVFFWNRPITQYQSQFLLTVFALFLIVKLSLTLTDDRYKIESRKRQETTEFSALAQIYTTKKERIISYSFQNFEYIAADRLPASGHYFYFPWQEKYNENPKFGIITDACADIKKNRPKVMLIDKFDKWSGITPSPWGQANYGQCIQKIIDENYNQIPNKPYYIRKDLDSMGFLLINPPTTLHASKRLEVTLPLKISMTVSHQKKSVGLRRLGIMFGTQNKKNQGVAELRLSGPNDSNFIQSFTIPDLPDFKYRYFEIDSKIYTAGEIVATSGGGVTLWETFNDKLGTLTCIRYDYVDETTYFSPGCPWL